MHKYKLSAIIPVANFSLFEPNVSRIIRDASQFDIQVVVVIDTNDEVEGKAIVENFKSSFPMKVTAAYGEFNSPGLARNFGFTKAQGEWITYWDADDNPNPEAFLEMITLAESDKEEIAFGDFITDDGKNNWTYEFPARIEDHLLLVSHPGLWRFVFKAPILKDQKFTEYLWGEDQLFLLSILVRSRILPKKYPLVVYKYNMNVTGQLTSNLHNNHYIQLVINDIKILLAGALKNQAPLIEVFLWKNVVTLLKRGNRSTKFFAIRSALSLIMNKKNLANLHKFLEIILIRKRSLEPNSLEIAIAGGLGNQLFQYFSALNSCNGGQVTVVSDLFKNSKNQFGEPEIFSILTKEYQNEVKIEPSYFMRKVANWSLRNISNYTFKKRIRFINKGIHFLINKFLFPILFRSRYVVSAQSASTFKLNVHSRKTKTIIGYFQTSEIAKYLSQEDDDAQKCQSRIIDFKIEKSEFRTLGVHIRLGDYETDTYLKPPTLKYFDVAINRAFEDGNYDHINIYSNNEELALTYIPTIYREISQIVPSKFMDGRELIAHMGINTSIVISNSTLSWWSAALGKFDFVYAPDPWFANTDQYNDILPASWIKIAQ